MICLAFCQDSLLVHSSLFISTILRGTEVEHAFAQRVFSWCPVPQAFRWVPPNSMHLLIATLYGSTCDVYSNPSSSTICNCQIPSPFFLSPLLVVVHTGIN